MREYHDEGMIRRRQGLLLSHDDPLDLVVLDDLLFEEELHRKQLLGLLSHQEYLAHVSLSQDLSLLRLLGRTSMLCPLRESAL